MPEALRSRHPARAALIGCIVALGLYGLSFLGAQVRIIEPILGAILIALVGVAFWRSFTLGTAAVLIELVAGSLGRLCIFPGGLSLRMAIFLVAVLATAIRLARNREDRVFVWQNVYRGTNLFLAAVILWGVVHGLLTHPLDRKSVV